MAASILKTSADEPSPETSCIC